MPYSPLIEMKDTHMSALYDTLAHRSAAQREADHLADLQNLVHHARANAPYYTKTLANIDPDTLTSLADLAKLPILRKSDIAEIQGQFPPFGGIAVGDLPTQAHLFLSPGNIAEPQTRTAHTQDLARALHAANFKANDTVLNCFSYHITPAGMMFDAAARHLGCAVIPAGPGQTDLQAQLIARFKPQAYIGTPDFLQLILEKAENLSIDAQCLTKACVTGGPLFPSLAQKYKERQIALRQCYATAELGLIAYEADAEEGLIMAEQTLVEIVRPGTDFPVPDGEIGEVVVTSFAKNYPLIRYCTGDLSSILPASGSNSRKRLSGWKGRADQTAKLRGMFIHPTQIAAVIAGLNLSGRVRLEISLSDTHQDHALLKVEHHTQDHPDLIAQLQDRFRAECRLRADIQIVAPKSLPNDGKVIDDQRT